MVLCHQVVFGMHIQETRYILNMESAKYCVCEVPEVFFLEPTLPHLVLEYQEYKNVAYEINNK